MNNSKILWMVVVVGLIAGALPYVIRHAPEWVESVREATRTAEVQPAPAPAPAPPPAKARVTKPNAARGAAAAADAADAAAIAAAEPGSEPSVGGGAATAPGAARRGRGTVAVPAAPTNLFLPGNAATWTRLDLSVTEPMRLRTGGEMAVGPNMIGANGFHAVVRAEDLVLPSAPYMSVIGRVCSAGGCSKPFAVGNGALVCPSQLGVTGTLELWTNNYRGTRVADTRSVYSQASGGFYVYAAAADGDACATGSAADAAATALAEGAQLTRATFVVSSRQGGWKPFFVPLGAPIRIRASGEIRPSGNLAPTGPEGIAVTDPVWWAYPGTSSIVVDAEHPLFLSGAPYQSLIGRVCGASRCGTPFLVGRDRTVCAEPDMQDRLELWINNTIAPKGLIEQAMPLTLQSFNMQARTGEYRFTVTGTSRAACGGAASR